MRALVFSTMLLAASAAACGSVETSQAVLRAPSPPTGQRIELYLVPQPIPRPYYDVALLQAVGTGGEATAESVVRALSIRASQLGCDAIVRLVIDLGYARVHAAGVCVKWLGGPVSTRPELVPRPDSNGLSPSSPPGGPDNTPKDTMRHNDGF